MKDILKAPFILELGDITDQLAQNGWHERNSGNISMIMDESELNKYIDVKTNIRNIALDVDAKELKGTYLLVTGSGKYLRNVSKNPKRNTGIIKINDDGQSASIVWGFDDQGVPTSELSTHLLSHIARLKVDRNHRVVIHTHVTNTMAMTFVHDLDEKAFTKTLWSMCTESIVVFPDGVSVLPWMVCGTKEIGVATAKKMHDSRVVVWAMHGIFATGSDLDDVFGLIETVEKSATIFMLTHQMEKKNTISNEQLKLLAQNFNVTYKKDYLD